MSAPTVNPTTPSTPAESAPPKRSGFEGVKEASRQLRGTIALELVQDVDHLNDQNKNLIKFHGSYQQEDRDARKNRRQGRASARLTCSWFAARFRAGG